MVLRFEYLDMDVVTADVEVDFAARKIKYQTYTENIYALPFGNKMNPNMIDLNRFFESRCFPKERRNWRQLLDDLGLDTYDPLEIVKKTHGRQLEDYCWIRFEGEELDYDTDIKLRD